MNKKQKKVLMRIIASFAMVAILAIVEHFFPINRYIMAVLYLVPYLVIGHDILKKAFKGIIQGQVFDENFLMAVATVGAYIIAVTSTGDFLEAVAVMLFYQVGELFQSIAVGKSRRSISDLMDIRPDYANIEGEDGLEQVDPDEVAIGTIIVVQPGEKIPIDGIIEEGSTSIDTRALTGESVPRSAAIGSEVLSGCINLSGVIKVRTTKEFGESTASKVLDMVENASSRKSRSENFISRFARYYTPAVCFSALALAVLPPLFNLVTGNAANFGDWVYRALTFLVISCPCALVISIPLGFFAGIGGASAAGVLVKGSNYLEALSKAKVAVFDKTGTLTEGVFEVTAIAPVGMDEKNLLELAALAESHSSHPIALSLLTAYGKKPEMDRIGAVEEISGHGLKAEVDGRTVACGNIKLMREMRIDCEAAQEAGTIVYVAVDGRYAGHIRISDKAKATSKEALKALHNNGIERTIMLTGDSAAAAKSVAAELGLDEVYHELLPQDKVEKVEELLGNCSGSLVFVGDGINDAPVLSRADIGIAMGAMGSDAAIEAADVVLMDDDPLKVVKAIRIARKCMRIVYENIVFALGVKALCLILGMLGIANMWLAIFADVGVMVIAVMNAIRALMVKKL